MEKIIQNLDSRECCCMENNNCKIIDTSKFDEKNISDNMLQLRLMMKRKEQLEENIDAIKFYRISTKSHLNLQCKFTIGRGGVQSFSLHSTLIVMLFFDIICIFKFLY